MDRMVPNADLDDLNLTDLADRLAHVRSTRTNEGFGMENAVTKTSRERRILEKVTNTETADDSKLLIDHAIAVSVQNRKLEAEMAEIRAGGLFIPGKSTFKPGSEAVLEIKTENDYPLRVKCVVRDDAGQEHGVGVAFTQLDDSSQRRVSRLILELLKNQATS